MIVVLDANVWISGLHFAKRLGTPTLVLEHALAENTVVLCVEIEVEIVDDDRVLECAVAAGADTIISGDKDLLALDPFRRIRILTPAAYLAAAQEQNRRPFT